MNRLRNVYVAALGAVALAASAAPAGAATMLNVDWDEGCGATNCFTNGRYTHTWSAEDAAGPMTVGQLLLDRGILGDLDGKTFRLSFQLNGEEVGSWGSFTMGGIGGDELTFTGQDFTWNPEDGDLVLVLQIAQPGGGFAPRSFAPQPGTGPQGGSEGGSPGGSQGTQEVGGQDGDQGLGPSAVVPEPATWALMIGGFGLAGATLRRRRSAAGMQPAI